MHVLAGGRIWESGGSELANTLEAEGYERWADAQPAPDPAANPFGDLLTLTAPLTEPDRPPPVHLGCRVSSFNHRQVATPMPQTTNAVAIITAPIVV